MKVASSASGTAPIGAMGVSGARNTMPCASVTAAAAVRRAAGGSVAPSPRAGISTQRPRLVETPPVVGALQHPALALAEREGAMPVGTAVGEGPDRALGSVEDPGLTQQHDAVGLFRHLPGAGHRVPAPAQRGVGVGQDGGRM